MRCAILPHKQGKLHPYINSIQLHKYTWFNSMLEFNDCINTNELVSTFHWNARRFYIQLKCCLLSNVSADDNKFHWDTKSLVDSLVLYTMPVYHDNSIANSGNGWQLNILQQIQSIPNILHSKLLASARKKAIKLKLKPAFPYRIERIYIWFFFISRITFPLTCLTASLSSAHPILESYFSPFLSMTKACSHIVVVWHHPLHFGFVFTLSKIKRARSSFGFIVTGSNEHDGAVWMGFGLLMPLPTMQKVFIRHSIWLSIYLKSSTMRILLFADQMIGRLSKTGGNTREPPDSVSLREGKL